MVTGRVERTDRLAQAEGEERPEITLAQRLATLKDRFRPSSPVDKQDLFKGRVTQLSRVFSAVQELGQHAVVYGERGVGKTSISYIAKGLYAVAGQSERLAVRFSCSADDNFASIWQKFPSAAVEEADLLEETPRAQLMEAIDRAEDILMDSDVSPHIVFRAINVVARTVPTLIIIDELDRIGDFGSTQLFADLIKMLSDSLVPCTLLVVGVADDLDGLIQGHRSVERALKQIQMPRMANEELMSILTEGYTACGLTADEEVLQVVVKLSQGMPHYTHLLGGILGEIALLNSSDQIGVDLLPQATNTALQEAQRTIQVEYTTAVSSPRKSATFSDTLLACAQAEVDSLGYFAPIDVAGPLSKIYGSPRDTGDFLAHLRQFSEDRGFVLETRGEGRHRRYRFRNPLLQPFVLLKGVDDGKIPLDEVAKQFR